MATKVRKKSNVWIRKQAFNIRGRVLSVGSGDDSDGEGKKYREYFTNCSSYTTSDVDPNLPCDIVLDIRSMLKITSESFDCIFCSGVLEHIDDYPSALKEITRVLKIGGILLLGLPFCQPIHRAPHDYWRFTEYGIRYLLRANYEILQLTALGNSHDFPITYWTKAKKIKRDRHEA